MLLFELKDLMLYAIKGQSIKSLEKKVLQEKYEPTINSKGKTLK